MKKIESCHTKNTISSYILKNTNYLQKLKPPLHYGRNSVTRILFPKFDITKNYEVINEKRKPLISKFRQYLLVYIRKNLIKSL